MIERIGDWRGATLAAARAAILAADSGIVEEWKWMGSPVWERDGIIAVGNPHKDKVKLTFMYGAFLPDPKKLFNNGLDGNERRSIDWFEGDTVDAKGLQALVLAAIDFNQNRPSKKKKPKPKPKKAAAKKPAAKKKTTKKKKKK